MVKDLIIVKQDIKSGDITLIRKGVYDSSDVKSKFPFFNYSDSSYFEPLLKNTIEPGTKVTYEGHNYYVIDVVHNPHPCCEVGGYKLKSFGIGHKISAIDVIFRYRIGPATTTREKDLITVMETELHPYKEYWFINSKGQTSHAYLGEDEEADHWRIKTGNYWETRDEASDARLKIKIEKGI